MMMLVVLLDLIFAVVLSLGGVYIVFVYSFDYD